MCPINLCIFEIKACLVKGLSHKSGLHRGCIKSYLIPHGLFEIKMPNQIVHYISYKHKPCNNLLLKSSRHYELFSKYY